MKKISNPWKIFNTGINIGEKKMEIWKKEVLCFINDQDHGLELELYHCEEDGDKRPGSLWIKISTELADGKTEALEFPVTKDTINHLVAGIKKARMILKEQWKEEEEHEQ